MGKRIGQILCEKEYLNESQLEQALAEQQKVKHLRLGEVLLAFGYITNDQLDEAIAIQTGDEERFLKHKRRQRKTANIGGFSGKAKTKIT